jgi:hypothetical protein
MVEAPELVPSGDPFPRHGDNVEESLGSVKSAKLGRLEPLRLGQFIVERNFACDPARGEGENDEVPLDPSGGIALDHLAIACQHERLDFEAGLFADLADHRVNERLTEFDPAAGQGIEAMGGRRGAADDQHPAVAEDGGADREIGPRWINSRFGAVAGQRSNLFSYHL